ncbi:unnamed protein product [Peniophora sp. CBMAI 1063]|nr:unnamed protein product [Peniophora sp. CBMAI 1063]
MSSARDTSNQTDITKFKLEADGSLKRPESSFRNFIERGGDFEPEVGRYHLYVSYACPWAHRTLIVRKLKGLEDFIDVTVVSPRMGSHGWPFASVDSFPGADTDPLFESEHIKDVYLHVDPNYGGRFTVPVLFDKKRDIIVNNESSEIIRMFNTAFNHLLPADKASVDLYPENLRAEIDQLNACVYNDINNGVYKSGLATSSDAYRAAVVKVFEGLDRVESILSGRTYLIGDQLTEADVRLFVTIIRFDPVYVGHFKCNLKTIRHGYPAINLWLRRLYWGNDVFRSTTNFDHIKTHYYWSHITINPHRIVPIGPVPLIEPLDGDEDA